MPFHRPKRDGVLDAGSYIVGSAHGKTTKLAHVLRLWPRELSPSACPFYTDDEGRCIARFPVPATAAEHRTGLLKPEHQGYTAAQAGLPHPGPTRQTSHPCISACRLGPHQQLLGGLQVHSR